jgi:hypothetical protein
VRLLGIKYEIAVSVVDCLSVAELVCVTHELKDFHEIRHELHSVQRHLLRFKHYSRNKKKRTPWDISE